MYMYFASVELAVAFIRYGVCNSICTLTFNTLFKVLCFLEVLCSYDWG